MRFNAAASHAHLDPQKLDITSFQSGIANLA